MIVVFWLLHLFTVNDAQENHESPKFERPSFPSPHRIYLYLWLCLVSMFSTKIHSSISYFWLLSIFELSFQLINHEGFLDLPKRLYRFLLVLSRNPWGFLITLTWQWIIQGSVLNSDKNFNKKLKGEKFCNKVPP